MKIHTNKLGLVLAIAGICLSSVASATVVNDDYIGANNQGWGDRIGNSTFEVHNMSVTLAGNVLTVQINTNYAGHTGTYGTGYGDLFLSSSWNPYTTNAGADNYIQDDNSNGTNWMYGLSLDGDQYNGNSIVKSGSTRFNSNAGGTTSLFELNGSNNDDAFLSDDLTSGTFRNGQEVVVDRSSRSTVDTGINGSWAISALDTDDYIRFEIDLSGTGLANSNTLAFHWGMTCGNDTIEGALVRINQVTEPAILGMIGIGLLGLGFSKRKRA